MSNQQTSERGRRPGSTLDGERRHRRSPSRATTHSQMQSSQFSPDPLNIPLRRAGEEYAAGQGRVGQAAERVVVEGRGPSSSLQGFGGDESHREQSQYDASEAVAGRGSRNSWITEESLGTANEESYLSEPASDVYYDAPAINYSTKPGGAEGYVTAPTYVDQGYQAAYYPPSVVQLYPVPFGMAVPSYAPNAGQGCPVSFGMANAAGGYWVPAGTVLASVNPNSQGYQILPQATALNNPDAGPGYQTPLETPAPDLDQNFSQGYQIPPDAPAPNLDPNAGQGHGIPHATVAPNFNPNIGQESQVASESAAFTRGNNPYGSQVASSQITFSYVASPQAEQSQPGPFRAQFSEVTSSRGMPSQVAPFQAAPSRARALSSQPAPTGALFSQSAPSQAQFSGVVKSQGASSRAQSSEVASYQAASSRAQFSEGAASQAAPSGTAFSGVGSSQAAPSRAAFSGVASAQAASSRTQFSEVASAQAEPSRVTPSRAAPPRAQFSQAVPNQARPSRAPFEDVGSSEATLSQAPLSGVGLPQAQYSRAQFSGVAPSQAGPSRVTTSRAAPPRTQSSQAASVQAEPSRVAPFGAAFSQAGSSQAASSQAATYQVAPAPSDRNNSHMAYRSPVEDEQGIAYEQDSIRSQKFSSEQKYTQDDRRPDKIPALALRSPASAEPRFGQQQASSYQTNIQNYNNLNEIPITALKPQAPAELPFRPRNASSYQDGSQHDRYMSQDTTEVLRTMSTTNSTEIHQNPTQSDSSMQAPRVYVQQISSSRPAGTAPQVPLPLFMRAPIQMESGLGQQNVASSGIRHQHQHGRERASSSGVQRSTVVRFEPMVRVARSNTSASSQPSGPSRERAVETPTARRSQTPVNFRSLSRLSQHLLPSADNRLAEGLSMADRRILGDLCGLPRERIGDPREEAIQKANEKKARKEEKERIKDEKERLKAEKKLSKEREKIDKRAREQKEKLLREHRERGELASPQPPLRMPLRRNTADDRPQRLNAANEPLTLTLASTTTLYDLAPLTPVPRRTYTVPPMSTFTGTRINDAHVTGTQNTGTQNTGTQNTGTQNTGTQNTGTQITGTQNTGTQITGTQFNTGTQVTGSQFNTGTQVTGAENYYPWHVRVDDEPRSMPSMRPDPLLGARPGPAYREDSSEDEFIFDN